MFERSDEEKESSMVCEREGVNVKTVDVGEVWGKTVIILDREEIFDRNVLTTAIPNRRAHSEACRLYKAQAQQAVAEFSNSYWAN